MTDSTLPMRPLLQDEHGTPIRTAEAWWSRARAIRELFESTIGQTPSQQRLTDVTTEAPEVVDGLRRTPVRIGIGDEEVMPAWLLEPIDGPAPAHVAIAFHGTTPEGMDAPAGYGTDKRPYGRELALRGWTVLVPEQFATTRRYAAGLQAYDTRRFYERFPQWSAVGKMIRDGQITLDALGQLPRTAGRPVATIGHSLGAQHVVLLSACDARVAAGVANCGWYPWADGVRESWFRKQWYRYMNHARLKQSVLEQDVPLWDKHEVAALCAPRALQVIGARNDQYYKSPAGAGLDQMVRELDGLYHLLDAAGRFQGLVHEAAHTFPPELREQAYGWMARQLETAAAPRTGPPS